MRIPLTQIPALMMVRCTWLGFLMAGRLSVAGAGPAERTDGHHVFPGESIQAALDQAARNPTNKVVKIHAGVYRPDSKRQALIWFNRVHEGIQLEAVGEVTLTAANAELADPQSTTYPAVVNHVVFFGDGISPRTVLQGFTLTGANHFVTQAPPEVAGESNLTKGLFFYADGGAVKIFGRSYPTLRNLRIVDNYASPCAGGVSIQHAEPDRGGSPGAAVLENCVFRNNRAQITGAAVDLLPGSSAIISNCLFVGNVANLGVNYISANTAAPEFTNSAPLTVFPGSGAIVRNCTFTGNRNAVDDLGNRSLYQNCVFWRNVAGDAFYGGERYELDIEDKAQVAGCFFGGTVLDRNRMITPSNNVFNAVDPMFDAEFRPRATEYQNAGFRPPSPQISQLSP